MDRRAALALIAAVPLAGCGYRLRQAPKFSFERVRIAGNETTPVATELRRALQINGLGVLTSTSAPGGAPAEVVLLVMTDQRERAVVGQTAAGQVRELQLRTRFRFRLRTPADRILIDDTELLLERDLSFNETQVLSKAAEEELLYRDMVNDIVQQVVRRLASVPAVQG